MTIQQQCAERIYELLPEKKYLMFGIMQKKDIRLADILRAVYSTMTDMTENDGKKQRKILDTLGFYITPEGEVIEPRYNLATDNILEQSDDFCTFLLELIKN